eukprot:Gb_05966 [translate_table: standard]
MVVSFTMFPLARAAAHVGAPSYYSRLLELQLCVSKLRLTRHRLWHFLPSNAPSALYEPRVNHVVSLLHKRDTATTLPQTAGHKLLRGTFFSPQVGQPCKFELRLFFYGHILNSSLGFVCHVLHNLNPPQPRTRTATRVSKTLPILQSSNPRTTPEPCTLIPHVKTGSRTISRIRENTRRINTTQGCSGRIALPQFLLQYLIP